MAVVNGYGQTSILDIRQRDFALSIVDEIRDMLSPAKGQEKRLPTLLLYNERGLRLFEDITYLDEYYLTNAEIEILKRNADHIAEDVQAGSLVVELGSGNLRKVRILLDAFEKAQKAITYYALDLSKSELDRTLEAVQHDYTYVKCHGLLGTYDDGLDWLKAPDNSAKPKCVLWMGSSIGNLNREEAVDFLRSYSTVLGNKDTMIIGMDACQDEARVLLAYNDLEGTTHEFILNGLAHANELFGKQAFDLHHWRVIGEYDEKAGRHQAFLAPNQDVFFEGSLIREGERVRIEESYKYSSVQSSELWKAAGLLPQRRYGNAADDYHLHVITRRPITFASKPPEYAAHPVPSLREFEQLWAAWDLVTRHMIPQEEMLSKPIKLRNACIFYIGHIPAFLDMHLTRATAKPATEPAVYHVMFERGIDPDVDNPEKCHAHSDIPDEWPPLAEILDYQERVRERTRSLYGITRLVFDRKIGRTLWLGFEHESMHLETLLYMLLQSDKTAPPIPIAPDFEELAKRAHREAVPNQWIKIPPSSLNIGMNDPENEERSDRYFGWDNEKPKRVIDIHAFEAKARPLTNEDYARFLQGNNIPHMPASWTKLPELSSKLSSPKSINGVHVNGKQIYMNGTSSPLTAAFMNGKFVRTVYGPVPLREALHWPVFASYDELASCAKWMNGRIPTTEEVCSIYNYAEVVKSNEADSILTRKISAVNGHLSNEGVEISPPSHRWQNGASGTDEDLDPHQVFTDLEGCNVGFKNFHPTPVTQNGNKLSGRGDMGGVWEWTSSVLERHDGFEAGKLYPAYTDDFFDGKHNIVLGGSWATHPRIAGRKTFVNWYQRNYPYAWCGARIVRDSD